MEKFTTLKSIAAPLPLINIDTDMIIPKQFLKTIKRTGLGVNLFDEMRYDIDGKEIADFVLNQKQYKQSKILVTGGNFGCGSSREHAPWALVDFGIRCIIAPSFADIFYNNCFKNGILPIRLDQTIVDRLMNAAQAGEEVTIDLQNCKIILKDGSEFEFELDAFRKECLIMGLDDIGLTLQKESQISDFESNNKKELPWLHNA
ncbi:MAG: 3-isopropylmalate dehydratase small subunit [Proteobacteria bacterium]|nr:3-isopropylmalate dehydratase small subunit [Pseudomonadota bacterium]